MKFIYTTDWHARGKAPKNRIDNYRQALLDKLEWCINYGDSIGTSKTMICGGDIFDVPSPTIEVADEIVDLFLNKGWRLATAVGNHDIDGSLSTLGRTLLGHLMRRGFVDLLPIITSPTGYSLGNITLWAHHYRYQSHEDELSLPPGLPGQFRMLVSHSMIVKDPFIADHQLYENIQTNADVLLLGHYHPQQPITKLKNRAKTIVAAPGALMRGALSKDDITRKPALALVEASPNQDIKVSYIDISCAAPAEDIFRLAQVQEEKERLAKLEDFASILDDNIKVQALDAAAIIEAVVKAENIPEEIRAEALRRIGVI